MEIRPSSEMTPTANSFLIKNAQNYQEINREHNIDQKNTIGSIHFPKNENFEKFDLKIKKALDRNISFFSREPPLPVNFIFIQNTNEWNEFFGQSGPIKQKGDRYAGFISNNTVIMYSPDSIYTETNLAKDQDFDLDKFMEDFITHEIAHIFTKEMCPKISSINWLWEGISMFVGNKVDPNLQLELHEILLKNNYVNEPPSDNFLKSNRFPSKASSHPISYEYGQLFIKYINENSPNKRHWLNNLIEKLNNGKGEDEAIESCMNKPFHEIYQDFLQSLIKK